MDRLLESVKKHEGYRNKVYLDTLGKRTVGVGHLCVEDFWEDDKEYEERFLMEILAEDLQNAIKGARELKEEHSCTDIDEIAQEIIVEMFNDEKMYDLMGRELTEVPVGVIYIKNNKKFIRVK